MSYRRWTDAEQTRLLDLLSHGLTRRQIADRLGRTFRAVKHRLCR